MKNKKYIYILSLIILVILSIVLFTSYGFINAKIGGNETSKKAVFNSQILKVEYSDGTETLTSDDSGFFKPGSTLTKTFTITNTGNVPVKYSINLTEIENDFERFEDLTYEIKRGEEVLNSGIFPQSDTYIVSKDTLGLNESKTYTLTINYQNSEQNQIVDTGKVIKSKITIDDTIKTISSLLVYGNGVQNGTPSPETPVEIESLGEKTKNLFDINSLEKMYNTYGKDITLYYNVTNGVLKNDFALYNSGGYIVCNIKTLDVGTYTLSVDVMQEVSLYTQIGIKIGEGYLGYATNLSSLNKWQRISYTFTLEEKTSILGIQLQGGGLSSNQFNVGAYFRNIQLEKGDKATAYVPYGKYEIPISISSKNLFDISKIQERYQLKKNDDGSLTISGYPSNTMKQLKELCPGMKVGQTITFSMNTTGYRDIYLYNSTTQKHWYWAIGETKLVTQEMLDATVYFYKQTSDQGDADAIISNIQFEEGTKATEYESYKNGGKTTYIYLDEPLRKVGDCDTCADYIDYENQQVVRYINRAIPNNGFIYKKKDKVLRMSLSGITGSKIEGEIMSSILPYKGVLWDSEEEIIFKYNDKENYAYMSFTWDRLGHVYDGTNIYDKDDLETALAEREVYLHFENFLKAYDEENRYMYYSLEEPIKNDIEIPVIEGIKRVTNNISICSENGVCASNIEVEYDD